MFACGNYPATIPEFRELVKDEAIANVKKLRHHPSIVIWAGNNEDYQFQETEHLEYDPGNQDPESWLKTDFPARYIYEKTLVDVTKELVPDTYYHFGSPYGGTDTTDPTLGDIHQWNGTIRLPANILQTFLI
jgi:beta-mannosidase